MMNLDIASLRSLQAVAEYGKVTRAAEALNMTQSALSMQIKRLETQFGRPILAKQGRGIVLTDFAREILEEGRKIVSYNDALIARITRTKPKGRLVVGIASDWLFMHVPHAIKAFRHDNPEVEIYVHHDMTSVLKRDFHQDVYDIILTTEFECTGGAENLGRVPIAWFGARDGMAWRQRPLPLTLSSHCAYRPQAIKALEAAGIEWVKAYDSSIGTQQVSDSNVVLTTADFGVNVFPRAIQRPGVEIVKHGGALPPLPATWINMYTTTGGNHPMAGKFGNYLRNAVKTAAGQDDIDALAPG